MWRGVIGVVQEVEGTIDESLCQRPTHLLVILTLHECVEPRRHSCVHSVTVKLLHYHCFAAVTVIILALSI